MDATLLETFLEGLIGLRSVNLKSLHYIFLYFFKVLKIIGVRLSILNKLVVGSE